MCAYDSEGDLMTVTMMSVCVPVDEQAEEQ